MHSRRCSGDKSSSFFEKVQLHFELTDLLVQFVLLGVRLLPQLIVSVTEDLRQAGERLLLPPADLGRVDTKHLRDLGGGLVRLNGLDGDLGLQARRVSLAGSGLDYSPFSMLRTI